jgi:hypothetical protein
MFTPASKAEGSRKRQDVLLPLNEIHVSGHVIGKKQQDANAT